MKRVLDKGHFTTGESGQAEYLVMWLNEAALQGRARRKRSAYARITGLIELAARINRYLLLAPLAGSPDYSEETPESLRLLVGELAMCLKKQYRPIVVPLIEPGNRLKLTYLLSKSPSGTAGEGLAARAVFLLLQNGLLEWVRQCVCKKWFFASRNDMRSCSPKCRHKIYEQTPQFKKRRRKYMSDYYANKLSSARKERKRTK